MNVQIQTQIENFFNNLGRNDVKEGDKYNLSNYRPISVLPVFSNVFEKVAYK